MKAKELQEVSNRIFSLLNSYIMGGGMATLVDGVSELAESVPSGYMRGWLDSYHRFYTRESDDAEMAHKTLYGFYAGIQAAIWEMEGEEYDLL